MEKLIADIIVFIHLFFILFVIFGALLIFKWQRVVWLHIPALLWGIVVELFGWICPLTPLEREFREKSGLSLYSGDFIGHYLFPLIYPENLTRTVQIILGFLVILINLVFYYLLLRKFKNHSK